jgi:hypothetical protein
MTLKSRTTLMLTEREAVYDNDVQIIIKDENTLLARLTNLPFPLQSAGAWRIKNVC